MTIWKEDLNNRKKNLGGLFSNPSTRPIIFVMAGLLVGMIVVGYMVLGRAKSDALPAQATVSRTGTNVEADPSRGGSAAHAELQRQANERNAQLAAERGQSNLPILTPGDTGGNPLELPTLSHQNAPTNPTAVPTLPVAEQPQSPPVNPAPVVQAPPAVEQVRQPAPARARNDAVDEQIAGYLALWGPSANQYQEFEYARSVDAQALAAQAAAQAAAQGGAQSNGQGSALPSPTLAPESRFKFVRTGSVVPARLMTPLTSDNPGPVLAEITSGPLAGARLIGNMTVQREGLLLQFSQITKPGWPDTYSITAVGMSDDGYTGQATDVNHHYLQRYTALFAGSFMQGYGKGLSQQGRKTIITEGGTVVSDINELNSSQIRNQGYGEVAQAIGEDIEQMSDRPTTIELKGKKGDSYRFQVLFLKGF